MKISIDRCDNNSNSWRFTSLFFSSCKYIFLFTHSSFTLIFFFFSITSSSLLSSLVSRLSVPYSCIYIFLFSSSILHPQEDPMDDDMDGELRPVARRFSFGVPSRRSSVVSAISIPSSRFQVSPPHMSRRFVPSPSEPSSPSDAYIKEETV